MTAPNLTAEQQELLRKHGFDIDKPITTARNARTVTILSYDASHAFPILGEIAAARANGQPQLRRFNLSGKALPTRSSEDKIFDLMRNSRAAVVAKDPVLARKERPSPGEGKTGLEGELEGDMATGEPLFLSCDFVLGFGDDVDLAIRNFRVEQHPGSTDQAKIVRVVVEAQAMQSSG